MSAPFNLLRQPWVRVCDHAGVVSELSMPEVFRQAPGLAGIVGEMPTQAAAVLRLHLAVAYRALRHTRPVEEAVDEWEQWWRTGSLPLDRITAYLEEYETRFDLFDPEMPFMQVADLHTATGKTSGLSKLIAEVPDRHQYFTTRAGEALTSIPPAEAARWLVHLQAYDPAGIKSGAVGDPSVTGGKGYGADLGWTGRLGLVVVEGQSLAETLLLNLVHRSPSQEDDRPVWERPAQSAAPDAIAHPDRGGEPRGTVDLMTWQARRVRLARRDGAVVDALIAQGDRVAPQNRHTMEWATAYRLSEAQTKQHKHDVYMPLEHRPERSLWRGLASLLTEAASASGERAARMSPAVVGWLAELRGSEVVAADHPVRLWAVGLEYGTKASFVAGVMDDALSLQFGAVTDPHARQEVIDAVEASQAGVRQLRNLAVNLVKAAGGEAVGAQERATELGFALLDGPFRAWLAAFNPTEDLDAQVEVWHRRARRLLRHAADEMILAAGPPALKGREISLPPAGRLSHMDAGLADIYFRRGLVQALDRGLPSPPSVETAPKETV
ncbi:MAG: type I-E CRISPR-associated protein Cse1/CasA [Kytococcus sp.]|nr:type I-E CRISPR-associated protein Cse1/CasA [Kytococcus sp.]